MGGSAVGAHAGGSGGSVLGVGGNATVGFGGMGNAAMGGSMTGAGGNGTGGSAPAMVCDPKAALCENGVHRVCKDDGSAWMDTTCDFECSAEQGCIGECKSGSLDCTGAISKSCDGSGKWVDTETCAFVCRAGVCGGNCVPGTSECDDRSPRKCDMAGDWQTEAACPFVCNDVNGLASCAGSCTNATKQCSGKVVQTCLGNDWKNGATCPYVCTNGACTGNCVPNTSVCGPDGGIQTCSNKGVLGAEASACPYVCTQGPGAADCTGECVPTKTKCSGGTNGGGIQTCNAQGLWGTASAACKFVCSTVAGNGTCTGACVPKAKQCSAQGVPQVCSATGAWLNQTACPFGCLASSGTCRACVPGSTQCGLKGVQVCDANGQWGLEGPACANTCAAGACLACVPNAACTDDGNACTSDVCDAQGSACTHPKKGDGTACGSSSSSACDKPDSCQNGICQTNLESNGTPCTDDTNVCTSDICNSSGDCTHLAAPSNTVCRLASCTLGTLSEAATCGGATSCPAPTMSQCVSLSCNLAGDACEPPPPPPPPASVP